MKPPTGKWLLITTRANWARLRERGVWVFSSKDQPRASQIRDGEEALVYLTAEGGRHASIIGAWVRFRGSLQPTEKPGAFDALYPFSIPIEIVAAPHEPLSIRTQLGRVSFLGRGPNWGSFLQGQPLKPIPADDFALLRDALLQTKGTAP